MIQDLRFRNRIPSPLFLSFEFIILNFEFNLLAGYI